MIDAWFGRVMDALDRNHLWDDTLIILTTDHGHYLGEKDIWGKPGVPLYQTIAHIPLMVAGPGLNPGSCQALTTSVDLFATIVDHFDAARHVRQRTHGASILPLLSGKAERVRDYVLAGVWGREVHYIDGMHKLAKSPDGTNAPLPMLSNRWSTMPTHVLGRERELPLPDDRAVLGRMPGSAVPVIHQTWQSGDAVPFWAWTTFSGDHLYDLKHDPDEQLNLKDAPIADALMARLRAALKEVEAPLEQFARLGL
jgi:arylsulfatase A-like enzyme